MAIINQLKSLLNDNIYLADGRRLWSEEMLILQRNLRKEFSQSYMDFFKKNIPTSEETPF